MAKNDKQRGLGRGLSALMADVVDQSSATATGTTTDVLPIEALFPNPDQPRRTFSKEDLDDLSNSIREKGVLQPLIVRKIADDNFQIVAGERRWRAAQLAQLHELPVVVRDYTDVEVLEIAIIENIQRADLNPVEEAAGYRQLMDTFGHTQEQLARSLGKSRSYIANLLRLLNLPDKVQSLLEAGDLSIGHARALVTVENAEEIASQIVSKGLSVRETEALLRTIDGQGNTKKKTPTGTRKVTEKDADTRALEGDLSASLGMKISIDHKANSEAGSLSISYKSLEQLDEICQLLSGRH